MRAVPRGTRAAPGHLPEPAPPAGVEHGGEHGVEHVDPLGHVVARPSSDDEATSLPPPAEEFWETQGDARLLRDAVPDYLEYRRVQCEITIYGKLNEQRRQ